LNGIRMARTVGRRVATCAAGLCVVMAIGPVAPARSSETQWWIVNSAAGHAKSESQGIIVRPEGALELGPRSESANDDSMAVIWAAVVMADGSVALAGDGGRIDRWTEAGGVRPWVKLPAGQVLALARAGDGVVAGTGPEGLIYRIGARGDTTRIARTGERYVWGLAPAPHGGWYAATGTKGKLLLVTGGVSRVLLDSDESNLVSLVSDGRGGVYAGGDSRGRVFHAGADGSIGTVFDASEDEIRALAIGEGGALYAAALSASAVSDEETSPGVERPAPVKSVVSGGRAVVYRIVPDSVTVSYWTSPQPFVFALASTPDGVIAATGNRAGLYRIEQFGRASRLLAAPQGQITALAVGPEGRVFAACSNPAAVWRVGPGRAQRGDLSSVALDARRIARFGRIRWSGDGGGGRVELATRSGNSDPPDTTWSAWTGGATGEDGRRVGSPPARYLQWKLTLIGGQPHIESVEAAWREENVPPRIDEITVAPQGQGFREGELTPRSESVTQSLSGGQKVEYSLPSPATPRQLRDLPMWARGLRTVQWRASDPNGDPLRYRLDVRRADDGPWIKVGEDLDATSFTWDTNALPDGRYRLRVTASDAPGNAVGEERTDEALSDPFTVDNTPPSIAALDARAETGAIAVEGRAEDGLSPLSRIEVSLDDDDWRTVSPDGGLADERVLGFHARLPKVSPGEHTVSVRAIDLAGNAATRSSRVTVPPAR
jgi:hypothetical protein